MISVDEAISGGHNHICSYDLWDFVAQLIQVSVDGTIARTPGVGKTLQPY